VYKYELPSDVILITFIFKDILILYYYFFIIFTVDNKIEGNFPRKKIIQLITKLL